MEAKKPLVILKNCFLRDGQAITDFAKEVREVKALPDYKEFVEECAKYLGVEANWS